jgi:hypothetical protein
MASRRQSAKRAWAAIVRSAVVLAIALSSSALLHAQATAPAQPDSANLPSQPAAGTASLSPGTKLVLKDGSYELVREYKVEGDRVRYYSLDRSQWEVIPTALVDWNATKKIEAEKAQSDASLVAKAQRQEDERRAAPPLDIDASLEAAPGIFIPPGQGLFVFDGKSVLQLPQAETTSSHPKGHFLEQVLVPIPIIPTRHTISIRGERAKFRLRNHQPEFYLRTGDDREPDVELIRARVHHGDRQVMNVDELLGDSHSTSDTLPMQRWTVARGVYRFTLGEPLPSGEYVLAEILPSEGVSLYVWDFGVD